ncbi:MAG: ATP-binding protein [Candidatus Atribacteria bacterium]|nr:ATP-binding protein [Candidatus Atribacteria bacterium]
MFIISCSLPNVNERMNDPISKIRLFFQDRRKLLVTGLLVFVLALGTFLRFYQLGASGDGNPSQQDGGSGPGLAIAKAIVELHGGSISAENEPGKGTTIQIKFPK